MRSFIRAIGAFASFAPLALALPAAADSEAEAQESPSVRERPEPMPPETAREPAPTPDKVDEVPAFEDPTPPDFSIIDPNDPPPPGELPTAAEMEEKAKREAVGRQTDKLQNQSSHGVGQSYFGGGIF